MKLNKISLTPIYNDPDLFLESIYHSKKDYKDIKNFITPFMQHEINFTNISN